jgi:hypothetical protein
MPILFVTIGGYFVNGYYINGYSINGYWWLLVVILLMAIGGY